MRVNGNKTAEKHRTRLFGRALSARILCFCFISLELWLLYTGRYIFYILFLKEDFADNGYRRIYNENDYD